MKKTKVWMNEWNWDIIRAFCSRTEEDQLWLDASYRGENNIELWKHPPCFEKW